MLVIWLINRYDYIIRWYYFNFLSYPSSFFTSRFFKNFTFGYWSVESKKLEFLYKKITFWSNWNMEVLIFILILINLLVFIIFEITTLWRFWILKCRIQKVDFFNEDLEAKKQEYYIMKWIEIWKSWFLSQLLLLC